MKQNIKIAKQLIKIAKALIAEQGTNKSFQSINILKQLINDNIKNQYKQYLDLVKKNINDFKNIDIPDDDDIIKEILDGDVKKLALARDIDTIYNNFVDIYESSYDKNKIMEKLNQFENTINDNNLSLPENINQIIEEMINDINKQNLILKNSISSLKEFSNQINDINNQFNYYISISNENNFDPARVAGMMDEIKKKIRKTKIQFLLAKRFIKQLFTPVKENAEQIKEVTIHFDANMKTFEEKMNDYALSENPLDLI